MTLESHHDFDGSDHRFNLGEIIGLMTLAVLTAPIYAGKWLIEVLTKPFQKGNLRS